MSDAVSIVGTRRRYLRIRIFGDVDGLEANVNSRKRFVMTLALSPLLGDGAN